MISSDHARLDQRSLALHRLVAKKITADASLIEFARQNVKRWQAASDSASPALTEWEQILGKPLGEIVAFLTERSEHATRLRQSSPFAGILTEAERSSIYESYSTGTYNSGRQPDLA